MFAALALSLLAAQGPPPATLEALRTALIAGDLRRVDRLTAAAIEEGLRVDRAAAGLVYDLRRLGHCQWLGRLPADEDPAYVGLRQLVRLERVRLERRRHSEAHAGTWVEGLVTKAGAPRGPGSGAPGTPPPEPPLEVAWPVEEERWPLEVPDPEPLEDACPIPPAPSAAGAAELRRKAEEEAIAALLIAQPALPKTARGRLAFAHLTTTATVSVPIPILHQALQGAEPGLRSAGLLALAVYAETHEGLAVASELYREVLADPRASPEERSRATARVVGLIEPDFREILEIIHRATPVRADDVPELDYAEARALFAEADAEQLAQFGRRFVRTLGRSAAPELEKATLDLLYRFALRLPAPEAMAYVEELGPPRERSARLEQLASVARAERSFELAVRIYDRLRLELDPRSARGPRAWTERARLLALRAELELERGDVEAFRSFVLETAEIGAERAPPAPPTPPAARTAAAHALADLAQNTSARIANAAGARPQLVSALIEGIERLGALEGRYGALLESYRSTLLGLRGEAPSPRQSKSGRELRPKDPVRVVGEVVVPRLEARLRSKDRPTPVPTVDGFLVYEKPSGEVVLGWPW